VLSTAAYLCAYLSSVLFLLGLVVKVARYKRNPIHLRWELYPVAHEANKAEYGGSYLEEVDWVKKPRHKSLMGELRVMIPEIFFLKAVYESNRSVWSVTYPFHLGLYCTAGFLTVLFGGAVVEAAGFTSILSGKAWIPLLNFLGLCGFILSIIGALGLIYRRSTDDNLSDYTSFVHYFNLGWFVVVMGLALLAWFRDEHSFAGFQRLALGLVNFNLKQPLHLPVVATVILGAALVAYIPWTHMAHFFMKYYLYHDIRWGDEPMVGSPSAEARLRRALSYRPTWAASHVLADGRKTWADLAVHNPTQEQPKE
jgi:nitrate reductase gamma subunit